jgi:hypothetical protein
MVIPDSGSGFFQSRIRILDSGIKKAPDPGSASARLTFTIGAGKSLYPVRKSTKILKTITCINFFESFVSDPDLHSMRIQIFLIPREFGSVR